jgi:IS30 family transposase
MKIYTQLTQEQRYQIYALKRMGHTQTEIAQVLEVNRSTICRELQRNTGERGYRPKQAHENAVERRSKAQPRLRLEDWKAVEEKLRQDWSPEQVSGWFKRQGSLRLSHEWIYQHIVADRRAGGDLYKHLRCQKKHRKRYGTHDQRGKLPDRVSIEERPVLVDKRERVGDWEIDTVVGKNQQGALVSMVERKSRYTVLRVVKRRQADLVRRATITSLQPLADRVLTITSDNGKEFADYADIAKALRADFYFAHPYASWERGLNENTNGLIRQYFPKGSDFSTLTETLSVSVSDKLNQRPRKCLDFKTPFEVFFDPSVALTS